MTNGLNGIPIASDMSFNIAIEQLKLEQLKLTAKLAKAID